MQKPKAKNMKEAVNIIFPHQLFEKPPGLEIKRKIILVEEFLFFKQYHFHKQKIAFHRASMKAYEKWLINQGFKVEYIDSAAPESDVRKLIPHLKSKGVTEIYCTDTSDFYLEKRISKKAAENEIVLHNISEIEKDFFKQIFTFISAKKGNCSWKQTVIPLAANGLTIVKTV
jgi:deoxyribodipyrimidine photolyase-related protein